MVDPTYCKRHFLQETKLITFLESQEGLDWMVYFLPVWKLRNDLDSTKKFRQRSHLFLSYLKQPLLWWIVCSSLTVLKRDGANNSLRFFDRRKDGMIEPRGKSSFNLGLDCRMKKCLLIMLPTSGKFGLNVITNVNNFFVSFPWVLSKSFLRMVEALENWSETNLEG